MSAGPDITVRLERHAIHIDDGHVPGPATASVMREAAETIRLLRETLLGIDSDLSDDALDRLAQIVLGDDHGGA